MAILFLVSGLLKLAFHAPIAGAIASKGLPAADLAAWGSALLEIGAAGALIIGRQVRPAALILAGWSVLTAVMFHDFWAYQGMEQQMQMSNFLKNIALVGGLLVIAHVASSAPAASARSGDVQ
jgi:putative oxidoreductase